MPDATPHPEYLLATCRRDHHERIRCDHVCPLRQQRGQLPGGVEEVDPIELPILAALDDSNSCPANGWNG
jgi:hypothetical protein